MEIFASRPAMNFTACGRKIKKCPALRSMRTAAGGSAKLSVSQLYYIACGDEYNCRRQ
jgi:hypothetical protein